MRLVIRLCLVVLLLLVLPAAAQETEPRYFSSLEEIAANMGKGTFAATADTFKLTNGAVTEGLHGYQGPVASLEPRSSAEVSITVDSAGWYQIQLDYFLPAPGINDAYLSVLINDTFPFYEARNTPLYAIWEDESRTYNKDSYGNELPANPIPVTGWQTTLLNSESFALSRGLFFPFKAGENTIRMTTNSLPVDLGVLTVLVAPAPPDYAQYRAQAGDAKTAGDTLVTVQGEHYYTKNHSYTFAYSSSDPNLTPYVAGQRVINSLSRDSWYAPGESVTYQFDVPADGDYRITFKSIQPLKNDFPVFKQVLLNGATPFVQMESAAFPFTGEGRFINTTLSANGEPALFRLSKGTHTLTLMSTAQPVYGWYGRLLEVMGQMTDTALEIRMISGGAVDRHRDWAIEEYMPGLSGRLNAQADELHEILNGLSAFSDVEPAILAPVRVSVTRLRDFANEPNTLVNSLSVYSEGSSSFAGQIATLLTDMLHQNMGIDCLYVHGEQAELPEPMLSFLPAAAEAVKSFLYSFSSRSNADQQQSEEGVLNIWMGRNINYVEQLRSFIDQEFTPETGIRVNLSSMPDEAKLLLAVSAGLGPDVVLSGSNYRPFDFALRGALLDLRQFDDFGEYIRVFNSETLVPYVINDACYGLPETLSFQAMFYRKDVLAKLGLTVPETWDDVTSMLPTLERYGMSFGTQLAAAGSFKHFGVTIPFIQQFGGKVYAADGSRVELGDPNTLRAFQLMTDLYTKYSLPQSIGSFYASFRYGTMPIGMSGSDTYILLREAAPELAEQWAIAPCVGVRDENGVVHRYQMASSTSCFVMGNTKMPNEAWELLKWWMSTDTQAKFGQTVRLIYGPEFLWNTANLEAFRMGSGYEDDALEVITEQFSYIKEIPRNPAYFSVERELSNAWNKVVLQGQSYRTAIDAAITQSNRVITKKLKEFGYMDEAGRVLKPFVPVDGTIIDGWKEAVKP